MRLRPLELDMALIRAIIAAYPRAMACIGQAVVHPTKRLSAGRVESVRFTRGTWEVNTRCHAELRLLFDFTIRFGREVEHVTIHVPHR
jgi:hypothetical protein